MKLTLTRLFRSDEQTRGLLTLTGDVGEVLYNCFSLERGWHDNQRRVSCIPTGTYTVWGRKGSESPSRGYDHFHVQDVPGRGWILVHTGAFVWHSAGCVLVGDEFVDINQDGLVDVTSSTDTLAELRDLCWDRARREPFEFVVLDMSDEYQRALEHPQKLEPVPLEELAQLPDLWEIKEAERKLKHFD